jgi:hypothetical protein
MTANIGQSIAEVLLLDGDTIRTWCQLYQEEGSKAWRASAMKAVAAG